MVYHSQQNTANSVLVCGLPVLPFNSSTEKPQAADSRDIVEETLYNFRANVLFRNFEVKGPADKLLIYLTLFVCQCLKRIAEARVTKAGAYNLVFQLAHEAFKLPGEAGFALGGLLTAPQDQQEAGTCRSYLTQCRKELGQRLVDKCFDLESAPSKYWMAFAHRKFLNKTLTLCHTPGS